ncbi:Helix-loop-helix DNA-binding domain [Musa troglodytarum]|uniref:Helix-loop-helix DNA-binding domain n=1 Tax=Musa troglodytarum TaxID=320322 RepID=A0A9E7ESZ3_9LILI|nr:Helix-loop-helix DNA-binding domain [Musa troglodytarum]
MTLEALASAELSSFLIYDTIAASPLLHHADPSSSSSFLFHGAGGEDAVGSPGSRPSRSGLVGGAPVAKGEPRPAAAAAGQRKRKRRRMRTCKNKEEAENQRMTHIAVERNRRRQMNEHLAVLRSLMPESYIQRGDQASIVGGAIDFVKGLEQLLQSLEAQKRTLQQQAGKPERSSCIGEAGSSSSSGSSDVVDSPPFAQFFSFPQYSWCHTSQGQDHPPSENQLPAMADIEVTLIETHANVRILSPKRPGQLFKMVAGLHELSLTILHLNVTALDSMVLYSLSVKVRPRCSWINRDLIRKVEEGCGLTAVDDIAAAIHHLLSLMEDEVTALAR